MILRRLKHLPFTRIKHISPRSIALRIILALSVFGLSVTIYYADSSTRLRDESLSKTVILHFDAKAQNDACEGGQCQRAYFADGSVSQSNSNGSKDQRDVSSAQPPQQKEQQQQQQQQHSSHDDVAAAYPEAWGLVQERRDRVAQTCGNGTGRTKESYLKRSHMSKKHQFLYCPVEKVASTFWRRFMYQLENTHPMKSPFDVGIMKALVGMGKFKVTGNKGPEFNQLLNDSTKLLFVRDPFSRIFSAYVDKLLAPNPVYYKAWGKPAIEKFRPGALKNGRHPCGHDVTFSEFVSFVTATLWRTDVHTMPVYRICTPCSVDYTVIGKMETFNDDVRLVLSLLHINENQVGMERMASDAVNDALEDSVRDAFSPGWLKHTLKCNNKEGVARRIWRKAQIRGYVSWRVNYNIEPERIAIMGGPEFTDILKDAQKQSTNKTELKIQKKQAFLEAYSTLSLSQIDDISMVFGPDIKMFDYEKDTVDLVNRLSKNITYTGAFDWAKNWNIESIL